MFRGYLQTRLVQRFGPSAGIAVASVAFGVFHLDPQHACAAIPIGVALGIVAYRLGSILPAIIAHAAINATYVLAVQWLPEGDPLDFIALQTVLSLAVSLLAGVWFFRASAGSAAASKAEPGG